MQSKWTLHQWWSRRLVADHPQGQEHGQDSHEVQVAPNWWGSKQGKASGTTTADAATYDAATYDAVANDAATNDAAANDATASDDAVAHDVAANDATAHDAAAYDAATNDAVEHAPGYGIRRTRHAAANDAATRLPTVVDAARLSTVTDATRLPSAVTTWLPTIQMKQKTQLVY